MLFPSKYSLFVVFEMVHELEAFALVDEALDALHHAAPEVIVGVFPRVLGALLRFLTLHLAITSICLLVPYLSDQFILAIDKLEWIGKIFLAFQDLLRYFLIVIAYQFQDFAKGIYLFLYDYLKICVQIPLLVGTLLSELLLSSNFEPVHHIWIEVEVSRINHHSFKCFFSVFCEEVLLFAVVESQGLRSRFIVVLLQRVEIFPGRCLPKFDFAIIRRCHDD